MKFIHAADLHLGNPFVGLANKINQAMQAGQEPEAAQVAEWQEIAGEMDKHDSLKKMMEAEQAVNQLLMEINNIITKPIAELYGQD
ncbi:YlbF family regulator [Weissella confusa]|uniref:YlbF family regulator n=1 Tax=Weissella confusa TaxID=1583 RepID=A0A923NGR7_WEICO|nr:YlbF family regulator [Weissella confusa]